MLNRVHVYVYHTVFKNSYTFHTIKIFKRVQIHVHGTKFHVLRWFGHILSSIDSSHYWLAMRPSLYWQKSIKYSHVLKRLQWVWSQSLSKKAIFLLQFFQINNLKFSKHFFVIDYSFRSRLGSVLHENGWSAFPNCWKSEEFRCYLFGWHHWSSGFQ